MKSKIEIRMFAVEKAVTIMGVGTPTKDVVSKSKEIADYIIGDAELPEVYNEGDAITGFAASAAPILSMLLGDKETKKK